MHIATRTTAAIGALLASTGLASADCGIEGTGSVRILGNEFEAIQLVADRAIECAGDGLEVTKNLTTEHRNIQVAALTTDPATYSVAIVANSSLLPLLNDDLVRPLDDLVAQYGQDLLDRQKIVIDGQVMAIAFMANAQHLFYRKSLLEEAGIEPPTTYEEMVAAGEKLRADGVLENPLLANFKPGWDLGEEFINMYNGFDGELFEPGSAELAISGEDGIAALEMMKALAGQMSADFVTYNTNEGQANYQAGQVAIMNQWGSRASDMLDPEGIAPDVAADTVLAAAPTVGGGTTPATTLWWDGFAIAKNISDEDAEASFRAMMHGIDPVLAQEHAEAAAWLLEGYEPTAASVGVFESVAAGAKPYPMLPYIGLLHTALGDNLAEFMQGQESAEQALADVTAAYETAAREAGFLN